MYILDNENISSFYEGKKHINYANGTAIIRPLRRKTWHGTRLTVMAVSVAICHRIKKSKESHFDELQAY